MTVYYPNIPLDTDIPADSQDELLSDFDTLNNFYGVDHIPFGNKITEATLASPCVITSPDHRITAGSGFTITLYAMQGLSDEGVYSQWSINGNNYVEGVSLTVIDEDTFSIVEDTSSFDTYVSESGNFLVADALYRYGFHRQVSFDNMLTVNPTPTISPNASLFPKLVTEKINEFPYEEKDFNYLFFQNNTNNLYQLIAQNFPFPTVLGTGIGFRTPFGFTMNVGQFIGAASQTITYPIAYTTTNYFTLFSFIDETNSYKSSTSWSVTASTLTSFSYKITNPDGPVFNPKFYLSIGV